MKNYINNPQAIEKRSFEIIGEELGSIHFPEETDSIVRRVIHTTADFEYARLIEFKNDAVNSGLKALAAGKKIYADTMMIKSAVNSRAMAMQGVEMVNYVHDEDVRAEAKERGVTRSTVAMEKAIKNGDVGIFAIGNAPTALIRLCELVREGAARPSLVVGVPVGFVNVVESKEMLAATDVPYIAAMGRKGGSPVASAVVNALLYGLEP